MPSLNAIQTNFTAGEISPFLFARVEIDKYQNACYLLENFQVQRYGGLAKRGGLEYIGAVKTAAKKVRLVSFIYSVSQTYILEFGDLYVRFFTNGGQLVSGSPVEVTTPWDEDEIWDLQFAQSADVLYITHPDYAPRTLSRTSATAFALATMEFEDGPYLEVNTTSTKLTPAATGNLSSIAGTVSTSPAAEASFPEGNAFDGNPGSVASWNARAGWVAYTFSAGTYVCDGYYITATVNGPTAPSSWTFEGYDGANWIVLDTRKGQTGWLGGEVRYFEFINETAYEAYRLNWTGQNDSVNNFTQFTEIGMHQSVGTQTAFNLTASATTGINGGAGFKTTDVGRHIRILDGDGSWRWVKIIARTSSTVVTVKVYEQALSNTSPIANWQLGAWSDETGWPGSVGFYSGRLAFARTATEPQTAWLSQVDGFTKFGVSSPLVDSDAINATITSESINEIKWIAEGTALFLGTTAAIRTLGPSAAGAVVSPTNLQQRRETSYGASSVQPLRTGNTLVYAGYYNRDVREIAFSFEADSYVSQDLSLLAEHIVSVGIKQIAYAQSPDSVIWLVLNDGSLAGMTYDRGQNVIAFHRHPVGGAYAGGAVHVESVATIPGTDRDELWAVVRRTIDGTAVRYVERLSIGLDRDGEKEDATYLDSYLTYSGTATRTVSGLDHLEGETVKVWGDGAYLGSYTVASGAVTVSDDYSTFTKATVGLSYTAAMETLSPEMGAAGGAAQTVIGRVTTVFLRVFQSLGGSVGPAGGRLERILSRTTSDAMDASAPLFTGDREVSVEMSWERAKRLRVEHSDPSPFNLLGMIYNLKVNG